MSEIDLAASRRLPRQWPVIDNALHFWLSYEPHCTGNFPPILPPPLAFSLSLPRKTSSAESGLPLIQKCCALWMTGFGVKAGASTLKASKSYQNNPRNVQTEVEKSEVSLLIYLPIFNNNTGTIPKTKRKRNSCYKKITWTTTEIKKLDSKKSIRNRKDITKKKKVTLQGRAPRPTPRLKR